MKRTFWILIAAILLLSALDVSGQRWKLRRYEVDIYLAAVSFHGDIGLADRPLGNMLNGMRPNVGLIPRYRLTEDLAVSLDLGYIMYGGKDEAESSHGRVYSFNSHAFQHFARLEYMLIGAGRRRFDFGIYNRRGMINNYNKLNLYLYGGGGGILSKSTVRDEEGEEPLSNPGYDNSFKYGAAFPVGGGIKISLDPRWSIGVELGYQFSLTDWLDGYKSQFSNYKDSYFLTSIKAVWRIRNDRNGRPIFSKYYR